jgi:hypothetical protein
MDLREPTEVTAGDTIEWTRQLPDYPASLGWVLKYALRGPAVINLASVADGDDHCTTIPANQNLALVKGTFYIQGYVEKAPTVAPSMPGSSRSTRTWLMPMPASTVAVMPP